jgi:guanosine-3',5'-bis(diphosphate) 3'-pyrophosphohydrolase
MSTLKQAIEVATRAHKGQFRNDKQTPYITHPMSVMALIKRLPETKEFELEGDLTNYLIVAVLHDVIEDSNLTSKDLLELGFSDEVVEGVVSMTEQKGDTYLDKTLRAYNNKLGRVVKYFDIAHNMSTLDKKQKQKHYKYELAQYILKDT